VNARDWTTAYANALGVAPPIEEDFNTILDLAGEAAHASERVAAPVAAWLGARAGLTPDEALRVARELSPRRDT
jgi:Domain of unknown function (DUF6457)